MRPDLLTDDEYERLARYAAGEGTPAERAALAQWVADHPARASALKTVRQAWAPADPSAWDVDRGWARLSASLRARGATPVSAPVYDLAARRPAPARWTGWLARAAAVAAVAVGGGVLYARFAGSASAPATVADATVTHRTAAGERRAITLPDGSTATLGAASTLALRPGYGAGAREVELRGEAFFTVTHDARRPFRVAVAGGVVEDLGTEFAVRASPSGVRVAVTSGSVALRRAGAADTAVVLAARDVAAMGPGGVSVTRGVDVTPFTAFTTGRLIFRDAPLAQVAEDLARWYGVTVDLGDPSLGERHVTATFQGESLEEVLRVIGLTLDVRYRRSGSRVEFLPTAGAPGARLPARAQGSALAEGGA